MAERDLSSKRVFSLRSTIEDFVGTLPDAVRAKLDTARMTPFPTEHVSGGAAGPRQRLADTVWLIGGRGGHPGLAVAFEFQATVDRNMSHRALDLQVRVRDALARARKGGDGPVPPVLPVVISSAAERWRGPRSVAEAHAPFAFGDPEIDAYCSGNGYMLVEAVNADPDRVPDRPGPYHIHLLLERGGDMPYISWCMDLLADLYGRLGPEEGRQTVEALVGVLAAKLHGTEMGRFVASLPGRLEWGKGNAMDVMRQAVIEWERQLVSRARGAGLEEGRAQGLEKGRAQGLEKGLVEGRERERAEGMVRRRHLLRQLVVAKFGREVVGRFEAALSGATTLEELQELERTVERSGSGSVLLAALGPAEGAGHPEPQP